MESYWFAALPASACAPFSALPGGSSSQALALHGKAARTNSLGSRGLLQSHKPCLPRARGAVSSLALSDKTLPRAPCVTRRRCLFSHPLPTARTCCSQGQIPGGRHQHRSALSPLSLWENPAWGHAVLGQLHPGGSRALTSLPAGLGGSWWCFLALGMCREGKKIKGSKDFARHF